MSIFKKENGALVEYTKPLPDTVVAPIEDGATSTHNYAVGAFAVVKGVLRKVTSAITSGTAFSNSNSTATDVATELQTLNSKLPLIAKIGSTYSGTGIGGYSTADITVPVTLTGNQHLYSVKEIITSDGTFLASVLNVDSSDGGGTKNVTLRLFNCTATVAYPGTISVSVWCINA